MADDDRFEWKPKKKDYSPPGWVIKHFNRSVILDDDRAVKFLQFRKRLCAALGNEDERCNIKNLMVLAIDLLMANEAAILVEVSKL